MARIAYDSQSRQIFFLDEKGNIIKEKERRFLPDHIERKDDGWMVVDDKRAEKKQAPTSQVVKCAYCTNNVDPDTEEAKPLTSTLEIGKPVFIKDEKTPGFGVDGRPEAGTALYRIDCHCSNGHTFIKHFRKWLPPPCYDFIAYKDEMSLGLLDPMLPDE
jgi:hypothetical protein